MNIDYIAIKESTMTLGLQEFSITKKYWKDLLNLGILDTDFVHISICNHDTSKYSFDKRNIKYKTIELGNLLIFVVTQEEIFKLINTKLLNL